jgi:anti-anti-sigma factor
MSPPLTSDAAGGPDPPGDVFDVQVMAGGGEVLVRLEGELDSASAPGFMARLNGSVDAADNHTVRLDLSRLRFLDTAGARALLRVRELVAAVGGRLTVDGMVTGRLPVADYMALHERLVVEPGEGTGRGS